MKHLFLVVYRNHADTDSDVPAKQYSESFLAVNIDHAKQHWAYQKRKDAEHVDMSTIRWFHIDGAITPTVDLT